MFQILLYLKESYLKTVVEDQPWFPEVKGLSYSDENFLHAFDIYSLVIIFNKINIFFTVILLMHNLLLLKHISWDYLRRIYSWIDIIFITLSMILFFETYKDHLEKF